jgi:hypothetical protein
VVKEKQTLKSLEKFRLTVTQMLNKCCPIITPEPQEDMEEDKPEETTATEGECRDHRHRG